MGLEAWNRGLQQFGDIKLGAEEEPQIVLRLGVGADHTIHDRTRYRTAPDVCVETDNEDGMRDFQNAFKRIAPGADAQELVRRCAGVCSVLDGQIPESLEIAEFTGCDIDIAH